jgi:hypothetical protein
MLRRVSVLTAVWSLAYAGYRGYYAVGGTAWVPGEVADRELFRSINAAAAVVIVLGGALPLIALRLWHRRGLRRVLLALCWVVAVGCCMHALVDSIERILSLSGHLTITYPASVWASVDNRTADLQDLLFNEPWFLGEGLGYGAIGWLVLAREPAQRRWAMTIVAAVAILTAIGVLAATGVIGRVTFL